MKYRIKNPEIEKAVRGLFTTQEAYEKELRHWSEHHFKYYADRNRIMIEVNFDESITGFTCELYVATSDIEKVVEYDPKVWNCLALVTPPKINEPYRVLYESRRYLGWWDGYDFEFPEGFTSKNFTKAKILFKPWDDEESEE